MEMLTEEIDLESTTTENEQYTGRARKQRRELARMVQSSLTIEELTDLLHESLQVEWRTGLPQAQRIGLILFLLKMALSPKAYARFLDQEVPFSSSTAWWYMRLHTDRAELAKAGATGLSEAYEYITAAQNHTYWKDRKLVLEAIAEAQMRVEELRPTIQKAVAR